jgi:histidyl-tRNA synthetase
MSNDKYINPELPSGFRDYLPENMMVRQAMCDKIKTVFERFGFLPLDTPGIERKEVLTGGDENFSKQIFNVNLHEEKDDFALRFDLTVPLARVVSLYSEELPKPFKRYQVGNVWRGERAQAGRFKEFMQFDADIVGSSRLIADAEIIALMYETMNSLGLKNFLIKINNRKILNGLADFVGYEKKSNADVLRIIDKMDKIGWEGVEKELTDSVKLDKEQTKKLKEFLDLRAESSEKILTEASGLIKKSDEATEGIKELEEIIADLKALGVPEKYYRVDLSVARGLGYYTGPVFETILTDLPGIGSVMSGGRYDDLVSRFSVQNIPSVGASVGLDRLFAAMEKLGMIKKKKTLVKAVVLNFDKEAEDYCLKIVAELRKSEIDSEIYLGKEINLKGQLAYALTQEIPVVLIAGEKEKKTQTVQIKDVVKRTQEEIAFIDIVETVEKILS